MSFRNVRLLTLGLAVVAVAACDEFPEPLESDAGLIPVTIQPVDWPTELALQDSEVLEVEVVDGQGRAVQGAPLVWTMDTPATGSFEEVENDLAQRLSGVGLGWARFTISLTEEPFVDTQLVDSIPILLAGVGLDNPTSDTTLTAVDETLFIDATGRSASGASISGTGLQWQLLSGTAVSLVSSVTGDQIEVRADEEGTSVIAVSHSQCVSTGTCADTLNVTVDQIADSVALSSRADTLVAEDTIQLSATAFDANDNVAPNETLTWTSRNAAVATVDGSGQVVAQGEGQTWIVVDVGTGAVDSASVDVSSSGVLTVDLTDAPADLLASAVLYLNGVYVLDDVVTKGRRYLLDRKFSADLLTLADTVAALGTIRVPAATYGSIFLDVDSATITLLDAYTFSDGTRTRTFTVPGDTIEAPIDGGATFTGNDTIEVVLDFDVDGSFPMPDPSNGEVASVSFDPTTRVVDRTQAASIAGSLTNTGTADVAGVTLRAVRTDVAGDTLFTRSDDVGAYTFRYLIAGSYDLSVPRAPACHVANPSVVSVSVLAGEASAGSDFTIDPVTIDSIVPSPRTDTINAIGFTTTLSATAYEGTTPLSGLAIDWSSADPTLAEVDGSGVVTAVAPGEARIVAAACGVTDTAYITVRQVPASVAVAPQDTAIEAGATAQYAATLSDSGGAAIDTATFAWSSSDTTVATIDAAGLASAIRSGTTTIQAEHAASGLSGGTSLNVLLASAESFSLNDNMGCALTGTNQVVCWGANPFGGLGFTPTNFGDYETAYGPQTIPLPTSETYLQVDAGSTHACALTAAGDIYCWGAGGNGQLGNASNFHSADPVLVNRPAGETFTDVTAGGWFTCAATSSGQAYCWGWGDAGRLGNGTSNDQNVPTAVSQSGYDLFDLEAEDAFVCGIGTNDVGYCWGRGTEGQLGNGSTSDSFTPVQVSMPGTSFVELALAQMRACAVGADGGVYCWGRNSANDLRDDGTTPARVGTETFQTIGQGNTAVCGAKTDGAVLCAGGNYFAQYGNGTTSENFDVVWESGASGVSAASLDGGGWDTMCGLDTGGDIYCWGYKGRGLTGTGDRHYTADPVQTSVAGVVDGTVNSDRACVVTDANEVYCWADIGHLTDYSSGFESNRTPNPYAVTPPPAGITFVEIQTGNDHTCARTAIDEIYCIGENYIGQLGDGTFDASPGAWVNVPHPQGGSWAELAVGRQFNCGLDFSGDVYCWGYNGNGQLGIGTASDEGFPDPTVVSDVGVSYSTLDAGGWHACATTSNSSVYCWGWNGWGQLGNGGYTQQATPTEILTGGNFFNRVSAGSNHTCALTTDDAAYCWGRNYDGELGDGDSYADSPSPVAVTGGLVFESIEVSVEYGTCAIDFSGAAYCWGGNWAGVFGNGEVSSTTSPVAAFTGISVVGTAQNQQTACAADTGGAVWCSGEHNHGHTGVGLFAYELLPVRVGGSGGS